MRKVLLTLTTTAAVAAGVAGIAPSASAATSPSAVCGSGYRQVDSQPLNGSTVYLLYSSRSGNNCVVTVKTRNVGTPTRTGTYLRVSGSNPIYDAGNYTRYAGPTYAYAAGTCIQWGGGTDDQYWYSGWSHCG